MRHISLLMLSCCITLSAQTAIPIENGTRILFIGNSFTDWCGGLDEYVKRACLNGEPPITIETMRLIAAAQELEYHYNQTPAVQQIQTGNWDIVVLQGYNHAIDWPVGSLPLFYEYVRKFDTVIKAAGAQTVLFMHWAGNPTASWMSTTKYHNDTRTLNENYTSIGSEIGAPVVPCGMVWHELTMNPPAEGLAMDYLYTDDIHENALSAGLNSYVFYAMLTHRSPAGIEFTYDAFNPDPIINAAFQATVWEIIGQRETWAQAVSIHEPIQSTDGMCPLTKTTNAVSWYADLSGRLCRQPAQSSRPLVLFDKKSLSLYLTDGRQ